MEKDEESILVPNAVMDWFRKGEIQNPTQAALILCLLEHPEGIRSTELPEIAAELSVGLKTVQLALRALVDRGMASFTEESSRRRRYTLNTDWKPNTSA